MGCAGGQSKLTAADDTVITPQFLAEKGFTESKSICTLSPVTVTDAAKLLGFKLSDMHRTKNQSANSDIRTVDIRNLGFVITSLVTDAHGHVVPGSLDDPNALASVSVSLVQVARPKFRPTTSMPRLTITSARLPEENSKPLTVTLEIAADGKDDPIAVSRDRFTIFIFESDRKTQRYRGDADKSKKQSEWITIRPDEPQQLELTASAPDSDSKKRLSALPAGKYFVRVELHHGSKEQRHDYESLSDIRSKDFPMEIK
jgi:hypothetical protein